MNPRMERAKDIMKLSNFCRQNDPNFFMVRSQSNPGHYYNVTKTEHGLVCECKDHQIRKADCKHIKVVLEVMRENGCYRNNVFRIMERSKFSLCKYCSSGNISKKGKRKTKHGETQLFKCKDCGKKFSANFGFERKRYDDKIITSALQMYFTGMSVRDIADHFEQQDIDVSHMTIYNWVDQYSKLTTGYINGIVPRVSDWFRADEVWVKIKGKQCYLFASMDDDCRYWLASDLADNKYHHNADNLLRMTKQQAGRSPRTFITDGLPAYMKASEKVFGKSTYHSRKIHLEGKRDHDNNNKMERLNGEIRDREKVFRGLKTMDTAILDGLRVYYNYTKKHGGLDGKTPAEAAKIQVEGRNKWKTLIQNASLNAISE